MGKYGPQKLTSLILALLNEALVSEFKQIYPIENISFTQASLSKDRHILQVYVDCFDRNQIFIITDLLNKNVKMFRKYLAVNLSTRSVPKIIFQIDQVVDRVSRLEQVIREINDGRKKG